MNRKLNLWAIAIIWLFHITAIVGIGIGYEEWFISKTPFNLLISSILLFWVYPINSSKKTIAFGLFWIGGMLAEWIGVHYGVLFGEYSYGANFGPKLDGVPFLIGITWALLTFITSSIAAYLVTKKSTQIILAASLMVLLDFFMEHSAPRFDFWSFEGAIAPIKNYVTWFIIAILFQSIVQLFKIKGDLTFSINLYVAQLVFFVYFFFVF
jgi:putative membrane protein